MKISNVIRDQIRMMRTMKGTQLSSCTHHLSHYNDDDDKEVDHDFGYHHHGYSHRDNVNGQPYIPKSVAFWNFDLT